MLKKFANATINVDSSKILTAERALQSEIITDRFRTLTAEIRRVAPRSEDFLYFVARGIHAMEAAAIDPVSREFNPKIGHIAYDNGHGKCKTCEVELFKGTRGEALSGMWCKASTVEPFINQNGDAFSESELLAETVDPQNPSRKIQAYQTFIGRGLFTDHKSGQVENIRGIILDAAYDPKSKGVDLLIALDKVAYPELARQVTAGYSTDVSMGCQVSHSLCSECGNKAITENDYCTHVKSGKGIARAGNRKVYEVNNGLNFIEISMVTNGADPRAKIRTILASLNRIRQAQNHETTTSEPENQLITDSINRIESEVEDLEHRLDTDITESTADNAKDLSDRIQKLEQQLKQLDQKIDQKVKIGGNQMTQKKQDKKAYMQGTAEPEDKVFEMSDKDYHQHWEEDKHMVGQGMESGSEGLAPGYGMGSDEDVKKMYQRASAQQRKAWRKQILERLAYMQGTAEPEDKVFEMSDKDYHQHWEEDKHMVGQGMESGSEGLAPGYGMGSDEDVKKQLLRAKLRARLEKAASTGEYRWDVFAGDEKVLSVTADQAYGSDLTKVAEGLDTEKPITNFEWFASKPYGINLIKAIKSYGLTKVAAEIDAASRTVTAQAVPAPDMGAPAPAAPAAEAAPAPEAPADEADEMQAAEAIRSAADQIEEAVAQIVSVVDDLGGSEEGEALATDLAEAGSELGELGAEMAAPKTPAQAAALRGLTRYALTHADKLLEEAEEFIEIQAAKKHKKDDKKKAKKPEMKKKAQQMDPAGAAAMKDAFKMMDKEAKDDDEDSEDKYENMPKALREWHEEQDKKEKKASMKDIMARRAARRKLASELYNLTDGDMIAEAHPEGGNTTTFPGQPQGKVETVTEAQEADVEVAQSTPRGELTARQQQRARLVRSAEAEVEKAANEAAQAAKKKVTDAAKAAAQTAKTPATAATKVAEVDKETKQYYAELASESATGTKPDAEVAKFYKELTEDFSTKKASTVAVHNYGMRMKRAFALAMRRASLGQIENSQAAVESDVDRLMRLDDDQFTAFASVVENTKPVKAAASAPAKSQVRTAGAINVGVRTAEDAETTVRETFVGELSKLPWH